MIPETVLKTRMEPHLRRWESERAAGAVLILLREGKPNPKATRSWFQR